VIASDSCFGCDRGGICGAWIGWIRARQAPGAKSVWEMRKVPISLESAYEPQGVGEFESLQTLQIQPRLTAVARVFFSSPKANLETY
jgi:hypothetical protein